MEENLISEGIGVAVELLLVYLIITNILNRREKDRWAPSVKLVFRRIFSLSTALNGAIFQISKITPESPQAAQNFIQSAEHHHKKLHELMDLTSVGLSATILPELIEILDLSERIIRKERFILNIYGDNPPEVDLVVSSPIDELVRLEELIDTIKNKHKDLHADNRPAATKVDELKPLWKKFVANNPVFDDLQEYDPELSRKPWVFSTDTMKKMAGLKEGHIVRVYSPLNED